MHVTGSKNGPVRGPYHKRNWLCSRHYQQRNLSRYQERKLKCAAWCYEMRKVISTDKNSIDGEIVAPDGFGCGTH